MKAASVSSSTKKRQTILVPTDFSVASKGALEYAIDLARRLRAKLVVSFVVDTAAIMLPAADGYAGASAATLLSEMQRFGRVQMAKLAGQLRRRRLDVETILGCGRPDVQIIEMAKKRNADLIVMGTEGRTGLSHFLLGSVTERVVRLAPCPVLTVRAAAGRQPQARRR